MRLPLLLLIVLLTPLHALAAACPLPPAQTQATVTLSQDPPVPNNSFNIPQLRDLLGQHNPGMVTSRNHIPLGLTRVEARYSSAYQVWIVELPDGSVCASLQSLKADFRLSGTTVYVATELPRDSCIYREVLAHENHHVGVDRQLLQDWQALITRQVEDAARAIPTIQAGSQQEATARLGQLLEQRLKPVADLMMSERERRQAEVDSPGEYQRVSRSCNGELRRYIPEGMLR